MKVRTPVAKLAALLAFGEHTRALAQDELAAAQGELAALLDLGEHTRALAQDADPGNLRRRTTRACASGIFGDPHLSTFDRLRFDCQAAGEFIMFQSADDPDFMIQERFTAIEDQGACTQASVSTGVAILDSVDRPKVQVSIPRTDGASSLNTVAGCPVDFYVDGVESTLPVGVGEVKTYTTSGVLEGRVEGPGHVSVSGSNAIGSITIFNTDTKFSTSIRVQNSGKFGCHFLAQHFLPAAFRPGENKFGLLGTCNGTPTDDWVKRDGTTLPPPLTATEGLFQTAYDYCTQEWCNNNEADSIFTYGAGESFASINQCSAPNQSAALQALFVDGELDTSRVSQELQDTCGSDVDCIIDGFCGDLDDAVRALDNAELIRTTDPGGNDDPHFATLKGERFDYHGQCDLIYTTCPSFDNNKGLRIHIRTKHVEPKNWSTITNLAVKIGEDTFELQGDGTYRINGEVNPALSDTTNLAGHGMKRVGFKQNGNIFSIALDDGLSLDVTHFSKTLKTHEVRESLAFKISGVHDHRDNGGTSLLDCVGLSSTWDHPEGDRFLVGRSGTMYPRTDNPSFGKEWQVDLTKDDPMLFAEDIGQQLPDQSCIDGVKDIGRRQLEGTPEGDAVIRQAEDACRHLKGGNTHTFEACVYDVIVTGDVSFAEDPWYNDEF